MFAMWSKAGRSCRSLDCDDCHLEAVCEGRLMSREMLCGEKNEAEAN